MANETILVVDADEKIQKVLEVSLKKSGYRVLIADTPAGASHVIRTDDPDLIISETRFSDDDGFRFLADLKQGDHKSIPFIFLTEDRALPQKMKGFELGADDYLTKPFYLKEITTRADLLIQRRNKEHLSEDSQTEEFTGDLSDITMIDLLQTIESERQSGSIHVHSDDNDAVIYFQDGNILDAFCGKLQGEEAIYRLFLWSEGEFVARYANLAGRPDRIEKDSGELLIEGINRLQHYQDLTRDLPNLHSIFDADFAALAQTGEDFPGEVARIFRLFDGKRTLRGVIDNSAMDDVTSLKIINRLYQDGLIVEVEQARGERGASNLEAWLGGQQNDGVTTPATSTLNDSMSSVARDDEKPDRKTERLLDAQARKNTDKLVAAKKTDPGLKVSFDDEEFEDEEEELGFEIGDVDSDRQWQSSLDETSDAIKKIEQAEMRRREVEASHLSGQFEAISATPEERPRRQTEQLSAEVVADVSASLTEAVSTVEEEDAVSKSAGDTGELYVADMRKRGRRQTPIKSMASVAALDGAQAFDIDIDVDDFFDDEIEEDEANTAEIPNAAHALAQVAYGASPSEPVETIEPIETVSEPDINLGAVSEADAFEDSEPFEDAPSLAFDESVVENDYVIVVEPLEEDDLPSTERPTKEIRPLFPAVVDPDPSDPIEASGFEFADDFGDEETAPETLQSVDDFLHGDTPPEGTLAALPSVLRNSTDGVVVHAEFELTSPTITPLDLDGPPTVETKRVEEASFFQREPDTFDDLVDDRPSGNVPYIVLGVVFIAGLFLLFKLATPDDVPDPVTKEPVKEVVVAPDPVKEVVEIPPKVEGLDNAAASSSAEELGIVAENNSVDIALVMSGEDLVANETDPLAKEEPKELPKEVAVNELVKEEPKELPKEIVKEEPKEEPKEIVKEEPPKEKDGGFKAELAEAERLVKRKKWRDALEKLRPLSQSNPTSAKVAFLHGRAAFETNSNSEAIEFYSKAERLGYKRPSLFLDLAAAYQLDGNKSKAKSAYERFLELTPSGRQADEVRAILANQF